MSVSKLSEMTWEEVRDDLQTADTIAILPVGAVEAHGPHLPLTTDVIISESMARSGGDKLAARGYRVIILPALSYTAADFASGFPGTISIGPGSVSVVLVDIARSLAKHGLSTFVIANSHLDPAHIASLEAAVAAAAEEKLLKIIFPDISKKPWALRLSDEFRSGACHAGQFESSVVLAARPDLVREDMRGDLPPVSASLSQAIRAGLTTFEQAGGPRAYFGSPAEASAGEGEQTIEVLGSILEEAVLAEIALN